MLKVVTHPEAMRALTKEGRFERLEREQIDAVDRWGEITGVPLPSSFTERVSGDCMSPVVLRMEGRHRARLETESPRIAVDTHARCRKCPACLRARRNYWAFAALEQTAITVQAGRRTWFGTYTLSPEWQRQFQRQAAERYKYAEPRFEDLDDTQRYRLVCDEIYRAVQRYWKRMRNKGHRFRYFITFERHKSGLPHLHALVHEDDARILKRHLQAEWPYGFTSISLVGGRSARAAAPEKAAWYVAKYLSKEAGSKLVASQNYRPQRRA